MTKKVQVRLDAVLSDIPDEQDLCVQRLAELLEAKTGIGKAHLSVRSETQPRLLCVHFDPRVISVGEVREYMKRAGAELDMKYGHVLLDVSPMQQRKARRISELVRRGNGVVDAVITAEGVARVEFDRTATDAEQLRTGLAALVEPTEDAHQHDHGAVFGLSTELIFAALSGAFLLLGWTLQRLAPVPGWLALGALASAYCLGGYFSLREAVASLRSKRFEIDFLMLVAALGAAVLGEWVEGALLLFLFSLGHGLEGFAMGRAKRAIEALGELTPKSARVRRNGEVLQVPVEELLVGDVALVRPNERLPADGFVTDGESSVNQAPVTGESVPVDKRPVDDIAKASAELESVGPQSRVFAGTINGNGALEVVVSRATPDSTLSRVVRMVSEAGTNQGPSQALTDRFERVFVPAVLTGAALAMFAWVVVDEPFSASFYRAMALLVAASPCALAIATPSAVLSGIARAAKGGVLVKGGAPLENLGRLEAIAFDKTGTLTEGRPRLTNVVAAAGISELELLLVAVGVEALSDHPLAAAVVRDGTARLGDEQPVSATNIRSITGRGVQADIHGERTYIGKLKLFEEVEGVPVPTRLRDRVEELEADGRTTMVVRRGGRYLGVLGLMDAPRKESAAVIAGLRDLGISRMVMLSGDNQKVAKTVAREVGLDEVRGDLMPDDKVKTIQQLRSEGPVAMVGDGVNDAPAMANATVGIAMGAAGSDVALETADVALMADDLTRLPFAVGLSRATSCVIRQNLWMSLGAVAVLVPATIVGLGIGPAVAVHEGSTLVVVLNALRLLRFAEKPLVA